METNPIKIIHTNSHNIFIPTEVYSSFANQKINRVKVTISHKEKAIEFYAAVKKDKSSGNYKMMISKAKQKELDLSLGDSFKMQLFEDTTKYGVEVPEELEAVLMSDYDAYQIFENLSKGKQRSIIYGVLRFKSSQQKIDKALIMCENLKRGNLEHIKIFKLI